MPTSKLFIPFIRQQASRPVPAAVNALTEEILKRYGKAAQAVLFYGSCFRSGDAGEGLVDLYLLVDSYRSAYAKPLYALINKLLPPNVFYLEIIFAGRVVRAKYTVLSLADFQRGTSTAWFHSYLWGRFAQPTGILYARDERVADMVQNALAQAVMTFITRTLPLVPGQFEARELWQKGLLFSYRSELRAERPDKLDHLVDVARAHYEQITSLAIDSMPFPVEVVSDAEPIQYRAHIPPSRRFLSRLAWSIRFLVGKLLSVLRLFKALFTFQGGVDYVLWKIERHSGIVIEVEPRLRRFPLVGLCVTFWRLYRRGAFR
jgi:hypothetical protein